MADPFNSFRQVACIPIKNDMVCVVSSRNKKRWVFPKGSISKGQSPAEAAMREVWEEAGITGILDSKPFGNYSYVKNSGSYLVTLFTMSVTRESEFFPEQFLRTKRWVSIKEAREMVKEHELKELLRSLTLIPASQKQEKTMLT